MPNERLKLAVVAAALSQDPREVPVRAREAGFRGLLFDAYSPSLNIPDLSASGRREFRGLLSAQDRELVGLQWDAGPKGFGPGADVDQALARLDRVMESAAGMLSPLVCVEVGPLPEPPPTATPKPRITSDQAGLILIPSAGDIGTVGTSQREAPQPSDARPPDPAFVSQVDGALSELGRRADRYGVVLAFRSELASFAALERALQKSACPWFGVDLDPVMMLRDEWDADEVFSRFGNQVRHVRARDATRGASRRTKPAVVGKGAVNWGELLANLDQAGYAGWMTVDPLELPDRVAAAIAARKVLEKTSGV
jgi:sugar phosphate isomerase/epimerase